MYFFNYKDELYHYGKKGMKWGVRKNKNDYKVKRSVKGNSKAASNINDLFSKQSATPASRITSAKAGDGVQRTAADNGVQRTAPQSKNQDKGMQKDGTKRNPAYTAPESVRAAYINKVSTKSKNPRKANAQYSKNSTKNNGKTGNATNGPKSKRQKKGR